MKIFKYLLLLGLFQSAFANAQDVYYAGFSFIGDSDQNSIRYPVASKLVNEKNTNNLSPLDDLLRNEVNKLKRTDLVLKKEQGKLSSGNSVALSFALNDESIESNKWGGKYLYIYRVVANILVFDFDERKVIADYPVMVQYQDVTDAPRNSDAHETVLRKIYTDQNFEQNIFKEWVKRLETVSVKPFYKEYLQIRSVKLDDGVYESLPDQLKKPNLYETQVAQLVEFQLSANQGVPLLPFASGQSITNQDRGMVAKFSDGNTYKLKLPEAGYVIDLLVRPFKIASEVNNGIKQNAYGSFITMKVLEPGLNTIYLDSKFKNINYVAYSNNSDTQLDTWQAYQTSLRALFSNLTKQISIRNKEALSKITQTPDIDKQLSSFNEVLKKCM